MSKPLAEELYEAMGEHGAQFVEGGRSICSCGADMGPDEGNAWDSMERHNVHLSEVLAKTARNSIANEIADGLAFEDYDPSENAEGACDVRGDGDE